MTDKSKLERLTKPQLVRRVMKLESVLQFTSDTITALLEDLKEDRERSEAEGSDEGDEEARSRRGDKDPG